MTLHLAPKHKPNTETCFKGPTENTNQICVGITFLFQMLHVCFQFGALRAIVDMILIRTTVESTTDLIVYY